MFGLLFEHIITTKRVEYFCFKIGFYKGVCKSSIITFKSVQRILLFFLFYIHSKIDRTITKL